jgi:hypothetical protein
MDDFFELYFAGKRQEDSILVWTLPDRRSQWARDPAEAMRKARAAIADHVYFGLGTRTARFVNQMMDSGLPARGTDDDVSEHFALWLDLDVFGPNHKKQNIPPDLDTAHEILARGEVAPSIVVASGGGLQAYWLLDAPADCTDPAMRDRFAKTIQGWQAHIRGIAREMGNWDVDSTHDLSRVLRVPGTLNKKSEPPAQVIVLTSSGQRYPLDAFADWMATDVLPPRVARADLVFDPSADPPFSKWSVVFGPDALEPKARLTWERKRKDLSDQSTSGYDMSVAAYAVRAGWSDQEVLNALLANHRVHGNLPLKRQDYYVRTIAKARQGERASEAAAMVDEYVVDRDGAAPGEVPDIPAPRREELLDGVSSLIGVRIERIIKYLSEPPSYRLITAESSIAINNVDGILKYDRFKSAVAAVTGRVINDLRGQQWRNCSQLLLDLCEPQDVGLEATDSGSITSWLSRYLASNVPQEDNPANQKAGLPYMKEDNLYIYIHHFSTWIHANDGEKLSPKQLGCLLRHVGAESTTRGVTRDGRTTTTTVWRLPASFVADHGREERS